MHHSHNEYFGTSSRKICDCKAKNSTIYFWGNYICRTFHTIKYFCENCFEKSVRENLIVHQKNNNCSIRILGFRKERLPFFIMNLQKELNGENQVFLPIKETVFDTKKKVITDNYGLLFQL